MGATTSASGQGDGRAEGKDEGPGRHHVRSVQVTKLSRTGFDGNQTGRTTTYACAEKYPDELLERAIGTMLDGTRDPASSPDACTRDR